jgi:hypothetical protein
MSCPLSGTERGSVAANLEIPTASAERGVGAILNALRMILPRDVPR